MAKRTEIQEAYVFVDREETRRISYVGYRKPDEVLDFVERQFDRGAVEVKPPTQMKGRRMQVEAVFVNNKGVPNPAPIFPIQKERLLKDYNPQDFTDLPIDY